MWHDFDLAGSSGEFVWACGSISGFLVVVALLFGVGCYRASVPANVLTVDHEISPYPVRVGLNTITLVLKNSKTKVVTGAHIVVEADMSHAGMGPVFAEAREVEPGRYQAQVKFEMAGDWVILLHGTLPDGAKLEQQFDVRSVRP